MKDLPELDIAELLDSEEVMAGYLSEIMASGDSALFGDSFLRRGNARAKPFKGLGDIRNRRHGRQRQLLAPFVRAGAAG